MRDIFKRYRKSQDGNFAIISAVVFSVLALGTAGAIDYSRGHSMQQSLQDALDAATMQAALIANEDSFTASSRELFDKNFIASVGLEVKNVEFDLVKDQMVGEASVKMSTLMGGIIKKAHLDIAARSVVQLSVQAPTVGAPCFMTLDNSSVRDSFLMNSGATINTPDCEVHTHGTSNGTMSLRGGTSLVTKRVCNVSRYVSNHGDRSALKNVEGACDADADPFAGKFPVPDINLSECIGPQTFNGSVNVTMSPGLYCGNQRFNTSGTITFEPGTYVLNNANFVTTSSGQSWVGDDVTFYFMNPNSSIISNVGVELNMTGATSGPYSGMFALENENAGFSWTPEFRITDNGGFNFTGGFYLPNRSIVFNAGTTIRTQNASFVARKMIFNNVNINIAGEGANVGGSSGGVVTDGEIYMTE